MKKIIIGIAGEKNSGKDTIANIISYIDKVGLTRANYKGWCEYYNKTKLLDNKQINGIVHFADNLKLVTSIIFNIDITNFYNRDTKDSMYYNFNTRKLIKTLNPKHQEITIELLDKVCADLSNMVSSIKFNKHVPVIKLRTLLQYVGTNVVKNQLGADLWINSTISNIKFIFTNSTINVCCIPDVRFKDEANAILNINDRDYKGFIIKVTRNLFSNENYKHASEIIDIPYDYDIDNSGTTFNLYYKVLSIITEIKNKKIKDYDSGFTIES